MQKTLSKDINRIRALEGLVCFAILTYFFFRILLWFPANIPSNDFLMILWGTGSFFSAIMLGLSFGLFMYSFYFVFSNIFNDFFELEPIRKMTLIVLGGSLIFSFVVSVIVVIFVGRPLGEIKDISETIYYWLAIIIALITLVLKIRKNKEKGDKTPR